jgi:hypothetical protein
VVDRHGDVITAPRNTVLADTMIAGFVEASHFLRTNVVQARLNDRGNYGESVGGVAVLLPRLSGWH